MLSGRRAYPRGARLLGIATLLVILTNCSPAASEPSGDTRTGGTAAADSPTVSEVASGLTSPWGLIALADGSTLVSERDTRRILHLAGGRARMLRTIDDARPAGEGGLLGLAATQDQQTVFAYYTAENDNRIVSMSWTDSASASQASSSVAFPRVAGTTADGWPSVPMATSTSARARPGTPASRRTRSLWAARSSESPRRGSLPR